MMDRNIKRLIEAIDTNLDQEAVSLVGQFSLIYETLFFLGFSVAAVQDAWAKQYPGKNGIPFPEELLLPRLYPCGVSRDNHLARMYVLHHLAQRTEGLHWIGVDPPGVFVDLNFKRLILAKCLTSLLFPHDMDDCVRTLNHQWKRRHEVAPFLSLGNAEPAYRFLCMFMPLPEARYHYHESSVLDAYMRAVCEHNWKLWAMSRTSPHNLFSTEVLTQFLNEQTDVYKRPQRTAEDYAHAATRVMEIARMLRPLSFASPRQTYVRALHIAHLSGHNRHMITAKLNEHFTRHRIQPVRGMKTLDAFCAKLQKQFIGNQQLRELMFF